MDAAAAPSSSTLLWTTAGLGALALCCGRVGLGISRTYGYWQACKAATATATGVQGSWQSGGKSEWFRINDVIMGGRSESQLAVDSSGRLAFSGVISTIGGGFASMRTSETTAVLVPSGATKLRVTVEGDGQLWKVNLGLSHALMDRKPTWTHDFLTTKGSKTTHELPLAAFDAQIRGDKVAGAVLDTAEVCYVGLILSLVTQEGQPNPHFGDGPFQLVLHELEFE
jgi:NADH dehydrogenase [ubiquinone] 1 alpha subcomplex assembly factor 1